MNEWVYLNDRFVESDNALIPANDRGFIFADGIYEVVKYYNGKGFRLFDHLERFKRSLHEIHIDANRFSGLENIFHELLERNGLNEIHAGVYIQVSRGTHKRVHHFPAGIEPTVYAFAFPMPSPASNLESGIRVITHEDIRWLRCDIKSVSLLANTMLYNQAVEAGAGECILIRDGWVTEATHSSILAVKNQTVITHPLSNLILPGITRKVILEICSNHSIPVEERAFTEEELYNMDELIVAGTGSEITPVIQVNNKPTGNKKPGELTRFLQQKFFELV